MPSGNYDLTNFKSKVDSLGIELSDVQYEQFLEFYELLVEKNKVMNLTGITEYEDVVEKHFVDSIALCRNIKDFSDLSIIDIGTGAGFPGLPLKIAFPECNIVLMDSLNKRINFINEVVEKLGLTNITAIHARAEELARNKDYRQKFDVCVSRAVANLSSLSEYCIPFVKKGGYFISYKSMEIEEELNSSKNAIKILGGKIENVDKFNIPGSEYGRSMIVIKKIKDTPKQYPRKAGIPTKNPL